MLFPPPPRPLRPEHQKPPHPLPSPPQHRACALCRLHVIPQTQGTPCRYYATMASAFVQCWASRQKSGVSNGLLRSTPPLNECGIAKTGHQACTMFAHHQHTSHSRSAKQSTETRRYRTLHPSAPASPAAPPSSSMPESNGSTGGERLLLTPLSLSSSASVLIDRGSGVP